MTKGRFIAFEGGEGAGKSTQASMLADALELRGIASQLTREPGGTQGAEAIRQLLLDPPGEGWGARAEALLFAAARSDHVEKLIKPALAKGKWVIADRFVDSSRAYQGGAGGMGDKAILALHEFGSLGVRPDCTLLIEADSAQVAQRLAARDGDASDAIGGRDAEYHEAVAQTFRSIAQDHDDVVLIDGGGSAEEVHARVMEALFPLLEGR
jgi:dTMP kinase